jgi:NADH-quinone oxidoreductase subunit H
MDFILSALDYLLGIPILGWGVQVGLIYKALLLLVGLLIFTAFILLADRKIWAAVQLRRGPNVVGPFGLLQSFADLLKFALKEAVIPGGADKVLFLLAPLITATLALAGWAVIPVDAGLAIGNVNLGILYLLAISSLGVYGVIIGGWASNSKYPFLGSLRSAAQMVSYEVSIGLVIITVLLCVGSLNLQDIVVAQQEMGLAHTLGVPWLSFLNWFWLPLFPMFVVFYISALAETNRPPFDLVEGESELVAGFMTEYSATPYLLFMLGEYISILLMCAMTTILFLGGWASPIDLPPFTWIPGLVWFFIKVSMVFFMFAMAKAIVPRYRYDQLMRIGWKLFLPLSLPWSSLLLSCFSLRAGAGMEGWPDARHPIRQYAAAYGAGESLWPDHALLLLAAADHQLPFREGTRVPPLPW